MSELYDENLMPRRQFSGRGTYVPEGAASKEYSAQNGTFSINHILRIKIPPFNSNKTSKTL
jgi:hypothetical protein